MINFANLFTIQLIFVTIYGFYYTFGIIYGSHFIISVKFYLYL